MTASVTDLERERQNNFLHPIKMKSKPPGFHLNQVLKRQASEQLGGTRGPGSMSGRPTDSKGCPLGGALGRGLVLTGICLPPAGHLCLLSPCDFCQLSAGVRKTNRWGMANWDGLECTGGLMQIWTQIPERASEVWVQSETNAEAENKSFDVYLVLKIT